MASAGRGDSFNGNGNRGGRYRGGGGSGRQLFRRGGREGSNRGGSARRGNVAPTVDPFILYESLNRCPIKEWNIESFIDTVAQSNVSNEITNRRPIASYNRDRKSEVPKIVVPGAPKEFYEWQGGDLSEFFGEQQEPNETSLDSMFAAIRVMEPGFKLSDFDIASDLDSIAGLFYYCLQIVNEIRAAATPRRIPIADFSIGHDEIKLRINVQLVGNTFLMVRQEQQMGPAGGVGLAFRRMCAKSPFESMMRGETMNDISTTGPFNLISGMTIGNVKFLVQDEVEVAMYPEEEEVSNIKQLDLSDGIEMDESGALKVKFPNDVGVEVVFGGFKGDLSQLTPIGFASLSDRATALLHPAKWLKQVLCGTNYRYVGRHHRGVFNDPPVLKNLDAVRAMCFLDDSSADLWMKALECVLGEITDFARNYGFECKADQPNAHFAIVSEPQSGKLAIHEYDVGDSAAAGKKIDAVGENTLKYLLSTVQ